MAASHLQIINPSYCRGEELRLRIWQLSAEQHRLLEADVEPPSDSGEAPLCSTRNTLNKLISGRNYTATVQGFQVHSKLLRVNSESRRVTLRFYRVHIPCYIQTSNKRTKRIRKTTLYYNPEYDFMHLRAHHQPVEHSFIDFLYDLKAYDPRDVGLLNLAIGTNGMTDLHTLAEVSEAPARATLVDSLSRLQEIIWLAKSIAGRAIMGPLQDFQGVGVRFNHSMPVKVITPSFNLLRRDPRPVGPELKFVLTACSDPRQMRIRWQELQERWEIRQAQPARERVLFAYDTPSYEEQVYDIKTAGKFLKEEEERWLGSQQKWHMIAKKFAGKVPVEGPEELANAVRPAIGFWLFPAEALGDLGGSLSGSKVVFDMTGHWLELALSYLS
ncbi:hypothetical protein TOPH_06851 [Tolypocladium ophioglossoides CBS 100239]|uniref:2EXR domain-containing protein n=1 Tax=Tolypocladium ophioglossoides (strain CBS 100239) TaxID=1163406 RepID=A0A0L0N310_TOLOC|nr:hypothetical protein TOPH_06851 [Tolypocladium ophioglossoides CBS 100239]